MVMVQYIDICSPICKLNFEGNKTNVLPQAAPEKTDTMFKRKPSETQCPCLDWGLVCSRRVLLREFSHFLVFCVKSWILTRRLH